VADNPSSWSARAAQPRAVQLLPFGVVALIAQVSAAFQPGLQHTGAYIASSATLALLVAVVVLVPWDRMPVWSRLLGPLLLALWVGLLLASQRTVETGLTPLVLLPIIWVALYHGPWQATVVVIAVVAALELDSVIKHDHASVIERRAVLWGMLGALVVASAYALRRRLVGAIAEREEALRQAELLGAATRELNASLDPDDVVAVGSRLAAEIASPLGAAPWRGSFYRLRGEFVLVDAQFDPADVNVSQGWPLHEHPLLLEAVRTRKPTRGPLILDDLGPTVREAVRSAGLTYGAWVPIVSRGDVYGVLALATRGEAISAAQLSRCADVGQILELALAHALTHRQAEQAAVTDPLTGLANRRGLEQLLRERRGRRSFAVLAIDVDGLKNVNDRNGHAVGDELLRIVAEAIGRALRDGDVLARIGGDEFVAITFDADRASASAVAVRMLESVRAAHTETLHPRISIGVASATQTGDAALVLRQADAALYNAKRHGGARYAIADSDAPLPHPA
jgi:diguanylate cyclase (GGDEF)-like protein